MVQIVIKGLIALAFGALSFGVLEFVAMGLLPYFSHDFGVDISTSGHTISFYAFGVCFGVIYMLFSRKLNLKVSICLVVTCQLVGIILTAFASNFTMLLLARFVSGMPHGCFFGLGAIISSRIAAAGKGSSAMALMLAGQTISNVFGVPLGTALAHNFSWRAIFYIMAIWGVLVLLSLWRWLPNPGKMDDHGFMRQFDFLKHHAPYLVGLSILLGNGGIFCLQSYVSPVLTDFVGLQLVYVPTVLIAMGIAMTIYNLIAGRLSDIFTPGKVSLALFITELVAMALTFLFGNYLIVGVVLMIYIAGTLFGLSTPQQVTMLRVSPGGELIGVAFGQIAFNFGNAIGALLGGIPMELGYAPQYTILVALGLVSIGTFFMFLYTKKDEAHFTQMYFTAQQKLHEKLQEQIQSKLAISIETDKSTGMVSVSATNSAATEANAAAAAIADTAATAVATAEPVTHTREPKSEQLRMPKPACRLLNLTCSTNPRGIDVHQEHHKAMADLSSRVCL